MAAGDLDPSTQRPSATAPDPSSAIPDDVRAALTAAHQNELATQTQSTGYGASLPGAFAAARDKALKAYDWIDSAGGLAPAGPNMIKAGKLNAPGVAGDLRSLIPQTGGDLLANAAGLIPGTGLGAALYRIAAAGGGGAIGNAMTGDNPTAGAVKAMGGQALGEGGAGLAGSIAAHRFRVQLANQSNPQSDSVLIPAAIRSEVSAFGHVKTPLDVKQLSVQGQTRLSDMYRFSMDTIVRQTGDPVVNVPSIAMLGDLMMPTKPVLPGTGPTSTKPGVAAALGIGTGTPGGTPTQMKLSEALRIIQTTGEAAFAGPRTPESVRLRQLWRTGQDEIGAGLPKAVQAPNGTKVNISDFYTKTKNEYSTGQSIIGALNSRGEGARPIFTTSGNKVIFNQAAESGGGTPFQNAMFEVSQDLHPTATAQAAHRGGPLGTGDAEANSLPLWMRSKGLEGLGASIHAAFPRNPIFSGPRQPVQVAPPLRTLGGQSAANSALNTLLPSKKD